MNIKDLINSIESTKDKKSFILLGIIIKKRGRYSLGNKDNGSLNFYFKNERLVVTSTSKMKIFSHSSKNFIINEDTHSYCRLTNIVFEKEIKIIEKFKEVGVEVEYPRYEYHFKCDIFDTKEDDGFSISDEDNLLFKTFKEQFEYSCKNLRYSHKRFNNDYFKYLLYLNDYFEKIPDEK